MTGRPVFAYYGDDLTGSTDALEGLAQNGVETILFLEPPTPADLERFPDLDAVGVAGRSRAMTPAEMDEALPPVFDALAELETDVVHYKVCSTFDSAPNVGSIGRAIDLAQETFDSTFVPVSQGSTVPHGRYVAFGNLFAVQEGETYRIDRHPTMRDHPSTPMTEANLTRHLGEQTEKPIGLVELPDLERVEDAEAALDATLTDGAEIVVFDGVTESHLDVVGRTILNRTEGESGPLFVVGSSGYEHHMLPPLWEETGRVESTESLFRDVDPVDQIAVVSGSASPVTAAQMEWAREHGFGTIRVDTERLVDPHEADDARREAVEAALDVLDSGESVICYSVDGPEDPAIERTKRRFERVDTDDGLASRLGTQLGLVFRDVVDAADLDRVCIAGGNTSGYVAPQLGIYALEPIAQTDPGAPLCRAYSNAEAFDGLEITLKGGQTGNREYYGLVRDGEGSPE